MRMMINTETLGTRGAKKKNSLVLGSKYDISITPSMALQTLWKRGQRECEIWNIERRAVKCYLLGRRKAKWKAEDCVDWYVPSVHLSTVQTLKGKGREGRRTGKNKRKCGSLLCVSLIKDVS